MDRLDRFLLSLGLIFCVMVFGLLCLSLYFDYKIYSANIERAMLESVPDYSAILAFSRSFNFSVLRMVGVLLGFLLSLFGALYVLRTASADFKLGVGNDKVGNFSIASTSPGLIMVAAGVAVVIATVITPSSVDYTPRQIIMETTSGSGDGVAAYGEQNSQAEGE